MEHEKDQLQQHQSNGEPPLPEHMIFQVKDHGKAKDVLRVHCNAPSINIPSSLVK